MKLKTHDFSFKLVVGLGYWKDVFTKDEGGYDGISYNILLPFMRFRFGYIELPGSTASIKSVYTFKPYANVIEHPGSSAPRKTGQEQRRERRKLKK